MSSFNWKQYIYNYPDLQNAGINSHDLALAHYTRFGIRENRTDKHLIERNEYTNTYHTYLYSVTLYKNEAFIGSVFESGNYWDLETLLKLKDYIPSNKNILEIGGHCGTSSLIYSSFIEPGFKLYVYEPQTKMFELLVKNVSQNGLTDKIKPFNKGVFCFEGHGYMNHEDLELKSNVLDSITNENKCNFGGVCLGSSGELVELTTIDNMEHENIGFIHCDAQGSENFIFSKGTEFIKKNRPVILYENVENDGDYLFETVKSNYNQYNFTFNIKEYCKSIGYSKCIDKFNDSMDTLLIP